MKRGRTDEDLYVCISDFVKKTFWAKFRKRWGENVGREGDNEKER